MSKKNHDIPYDVFHWSKVTIGALSFVCVLLLLAVIGLGAITAKLYVKKEKVPEPIIYEVDKASNLIVRIERGKLLQSQQSLLRSVTMRDYVFNRESINHIDEKDRWRKVRFMSGRTVWENFSNVMNPELNDNSPLLNKDFTRQVDVIYDYAIDENTYRVEYNVIDSIKGEAKPAKRYVAIMKYNQSDAYVKYEDRFLNLDGIVITNYMVREG